MLNYVTSVSVQGLNPLYSRSIRSCSASRSFCTFQPLKRTLRDGYMPALIFESRKREIEYEVCLISQKLKCIFLEELRGDFFCD